MNIYQRINEVRKKVAYIQKDKAIQGYKAITHDLVTSELRQHLIDHGVVIVPHELESTHSPTGKATSSGTPITCFAAKYEVFFVNMDEPDDRTSVIVSALGEDHGDKGPGKAISYATKTAMLKIFSLETGESDESRQEQKPVFITDAEQKALIKHAVEVKADVEKLLAHLKLNDFSEILAKDLEKVKALLEKKREQNNAENN